MEKWYASGRSHQLSGGVKCLREISAQLRRSRNGCCKSLRLALPEAFKVDEEKRLVPAVIGARNPCRPAHGKAVLVEGQRLEAIWS
jgi:hypothetical protein